MINQGGFVYLTFSDIEKAYGFPARMWAETETVHVKEGSGTYPGFRKKQGKHIVIGKYNKDQFERLCPLIRKDVPKSTKTVNLGWRLGDVPLHPWLTRPGLYGNDPEAFTDKGKSYEYIGTANGTHCDKTAIPLITKWYRDLGYLCRAKTYEARSYGGYTLIYVGRK